MKRILWFLIDKLWCLKDSVIGKDETPAFIIPHGYGLMENEHGETVLPESAEKTFHLAFVMAKFFPEAKIVIPCTSCYGETEQDRKINFFVELRLKQWIIKDQNFWERVLVIGAASTFDEISQALKFSREDDVILSIMEKYHTRRGRRIWRKLGHEKTKVMSVEAEWSKLMPSFLQRGKFICFFGNFVWYLLSFIPGGMSLLSKLEQPVRF